MKTLPVLLIILLLTACFKEKTPDKKPDRFYLLGGRGSDTAYIKKPLFDTAKLAILMRREFNDDKRFNGTVVKLTNEPAPIDGGEIYYFTPDLGIIYSKSTTWPSYTRLHSTNDSIEKRINQYLEHILSSTSLVIEGDVPIKYHNQTIKFTPPSE